MIDAYKIRSSETAVSELRLARHGLLTIFVPPGYKTMGGYNPRKIQGVMMSIGTLVEYRFIETNAELLHWSLVVRRMNLLREQFESFAIVPFDNIDNEMSAATFLRHHLREIFPTDNDDYVIYGPKPQINYEWCFKQQRPVIDEPTADGLDTFVNELSISEPCGFSPQFDESEPVDAVCSLPSVPVIPPDFLENIEESRIEQEKEKWVAQLSKMVLAYTIQFKEMPPLEAINEVIRGRLLLRPQQLSPIHVTGDMRIFLPAFNEMELHMTPLSRTVYILFLCHPEGIRMKDIDRYASELSEIYSMVRPGIDDQALNDSIADLVDLAGDSLQQKLSMTRRAIRRQILDPKMSEPYLIKGSRGRPFKIGIDPSNIVLPSILCHGR